MNVTPTGRVLKLDRGEWTVLVVVLECREVFAANVHFRMGVDVFMFTLNVMACRGGVVVAAVAQPDAEHLATRNTGPCLRQEQEECGDSDNRVRHARSAIRGKLNGPVGPNRLRGASGAAYRQGVYTCIVTNVFDLRPGS